jgi:biopolymer transport protein ExbD
MKSSIEHKLEEAQSHHIDLAPMLDMVFILLIFFIVTSTFVREAGVDIEKPSAVTSKKLERSVYLIAITAGGDVFYGGTNIGVQGTRATLMQLNRDNPRPLVVQADKRVSTELLVKVIDQAKLAGIESVNIATANE